MGRVGVVLTLMVLAGCTHGTSTAQKHTPTSAARATGSAPSSTAYFGEGQAQVAINPRVTVAPATDLVDGEEVVVQVRGFGIGGKVYLSECARASAVTGLGCGPQPAAQTFLLTDEGREGAGRFVVHAMAADTLLGAAITVCHDECVLVATAGENGGFAVARLTFR